MRTKRLYLGQTTLKATGTDIGLAGESPDAVGLVKRYHRPRPTLA